MKTWFITGASRGFGTLFVHQALARGDNVVATARNARAIVERFGDHPRLLAANLDVTDEAQARVAVEQTLRRFGRIDVLVNNAGFGVLGAVEETSAADVEAVYRTNVFGLLAVTRAVLPQLRRQRSGHVINISSIGGYRSAAGFGVYASTKFAVEGLSEALAEELKPLGIHVTVVEPGYFRTDFLDCGSLTTTAASIPDYADTPAGTVRRLAAELNHRQPGDPARLAQGLLQVVDAEQPPLRMPFGSDTVAAIEAKHAFVEDELATWRAPAVSTDFPQ